MNRFYHNFTLSEIAKYKPYSLTQEDIADLMQELDILRDYVLREIVPDWDEYDSWLIKQYNGV